MRPSMFSKLLLLLVFNVSIMSICLCGGLKVCLNDFKELPPDTSPDRYETWKTERLHSHYHLTPTDESTFAGLLPRKHFLEKNDKYSWTMMYRKIKYSGGNTDIFQGDFLKELSLHDVRLDPVSKHGQAQQTNLNYLLMLDADRLVWSFRKTAGLPTPGQPYLGWEDRNGELRGHFVGHYMSAAAQMWASTHNDTLKQNMGAVVSALYACQIKMGTGYLSAFPSEAFDKLEALIDVWAPYYTIHKIMAGLLDQHVLAGNPDALKMVTWMAEYFFNRVQNVILKQSINQHWRYLNEESGGMNDVLYRLYALTQNPKHLLLAHLFDKPCFLGLLAVEADDLSGFHANTHIPVVVGSQMRYEVTGESLYKEMGLFFMDIVNSSHSYATGGTSSGEFWSDPKRLAESLGSETEESCTTYNMLKVSRHLFRWTKEMAYADYYERALTNGVLSIQRGTEPGVMIYMLPLGRGSSKARSYHNWGTPFDAFWCCYGTGIESFSKLGDSIYFEENGKSPGLYIIQYIPSSLNWKSGRISLNMKVEPLSSWNPHFRVDLTVSLNEEGRGKASTLNLRIPFWTTSNGAKALLNGDDLPLPNPGNFLSVSTMWSSGDKITLELPISLRLEPIKDDRPEYASVQALLYGPYLLAGLSGGDWDLETGPNASLSNWIIPMPSTSNSHLISLSQQVGDSTFVLSNSNSTITMQNLPSPGTDASLYATFRLLVVSSDPFEVSQPKDLIGKQVMLEQINLPGKVVTHLGADQSLGVSDISDKNSSVFHLVDGLDGNPETVSLEFESQKGCFVYSEVNKPGSSIKLGCSYNSSDAEFKKATSFVMGSGFSSYDFVSFVAKGLKRDFLLTPLLSLRDESYTVYFNIKP